MVVGTSEMTTGLLPTHLRAWLRMLSCAHEREPALHTFREEPTVHDDRLPRHIACGRGREVDRRADQLVRITKPPQRRVTLERRAARRPFDQRAIEIGRDHAG